MNPQEYDYDDEWTSPGVRGGYSEAKPCAYIEAYSSDEAKGEAQIASVLRAMELASVGRSLIAFMAEANNSGRMRIYEAISKAAVGQAQLRGMEGYKDALRDLCIYTTITNPAMLGIEAKNGLNHSRNKRQELLRQVRDSIREQNCEVLVLDPWSSLRKSGTGVLSLSEEIYTCYSEGQGRVVRLPSVALEILLSEGHRTGEYVENDGPISDTEVETVNVLYAGAASTGAYATLKSALEAAQVL